MRGTHGIRIAALALAAAALPALAFAGEGNNRPQQEARIEQMIEQAIHGTTAGQMTQPNQVAPLAEFIPARPVPPTRSGIPGR